jgi:phosphate uptake regulator
MRTMFQQILQLFRGTDPLREILEMFAGMIEDSRWMYEKVLDIYTGKQDPSDLEHELFARDRQINATEREVRRRLVEYLSITQNPDVGSCLVLMSVAKDAERIGDYVKNMFDIADHLLRTKPETHSEMDLSAHQLRSRLLTIFDATREAFLTSNRTMAQQTLEAARAIARDGEDMVWEIAERTDISNKSAVFYALSARHVKRLASHLGNIATAVVQPVDWLDYADEPLGGEGSESPPESPADTE